jgi:hypothetical protein
VIWAYAIVEHPHMPVPRRRGLAQAPLDGVSEGDLLAVVTRHEHAPVEPAPDALWAHERVVERLMAERAVLPMRFGTTMPDDDALRTAIAARHDDLVAALDRVRGRVELSVRALLAGNGSAPAPDPPPQNGRDYILGKLAHGQRAEAAAERVHAPLARLAVEARRQSSRHRDEVLRAAYLVEQASVARFRSAVERLALEHPDLALLCTGPWPPYTFVTAPSTAIQTAASA